MDVRPLVELGVPVLEDAAQAFGAPGVAQHGAISTFSFYPTKNLFCLGDGGLVATNDDELAERVQLLSFHGSKDKQEFDLVGYNSRLDELQAAFLRVFLPELAGWNEARRAAAARYAELGLGELVEIPQDEPGHVYHLFVCRSRERDAIRAALDEAGIASATYYTTPLHLQPSLRFLGYEPGSLPATEQAGTENFSLPLWPGIPAETQERVVDVVRSAVPTSSLMRQLALAAPALAARSSTRRSSRSAWWLAFQLRFDHGPNLIYSTAARPDDPARRRDQAHRLHRLRLLQPLVALRLDARHVGDGPRRRRRVPARRPDRLPRSSRCTASGCRGRSPRSTSCSRSRSSWARASSPARRWSGRA